MEGTQPLAKTLEGTERGNEKYLSFSPGQGPGMDLNGRWALGQHPGLEAIALGGWLSETQ